MSIPITGPDTRVSVHEMTCTEDGLQVEHTFRPPFVAEPARRLLLRGPHEEGDYSYVLSRGHAVLAHGRALHPSAACQTDESRAAHALGWVVDNHEIPDPDGRLAEWEQALSLRAARTREGT